jgi:hypothetical protein
VVVGRGQLGLPLRQRLVSGELAGLGLAVGLRVGAGAGHEALGDGVGDDAGERADRADRVVVARDLVVDDVGSQLVSRIATTGMPSLRASLTARCSLLVSTTQIALGRAGHLADAAEGALELDALAGQHERLLLRQHRLAAGGLDELELLEALQALVDGLEVGEHAAEPALGDVRHADAGRLLGDRLLRLALGADEHDRPAVGDRLLDEVVGAVDVAQGLGQVDDVDAVALGEDEALHLRVPALGLVPEVGAALDELSHGDDGHGGASRDVPRAC